MSAEPEPLVVDNGARVTLRCPAGHEVVSADVDSRTGRVLLAGDLSGEVCGATSCDWAAPEGDDRRG